MISKEKFCEYMQKIKEASDKDSRIYNFISSEFQCYFSSVYGRQIDTMIEMLCDLMEIEYRPAIGIDNEIDYYIFERNWGTDKKDDEYKIVTFEDLYNCIVEWRKTKNE